MSSQPLDREQFNSFRQGIRAPQSKPRCLASVATLPKQKDFDPVTKAIHAANRPFKEHRAAVQAGENPYATKYIPGLTPKPVDEPPTVPKWDTPQRVPPTLIKSFLNGEKHPISALTEYASLVRCVVSFREASVDGPFTMGKFASIASIDGVDYKKGFGRTKKEAKTDAAKNAMTAVLGIETEDIEDKLATGDMLFDSMGRKFVVPKFSYTPVLDSTGRVPTTCLQTVNMNTLDDDPLQALLDFMVPQMRPFTLSVSEKNEERMYIGSICIDGKAIASGAGRTKKDAKRVAASIALKTLEKTAFVQSLIEMDCTEYDNFAKISHALLHKLLKDFPKTYFGGKVLATILIKRNEKDTPTVIALGTGVSSISRGRLTSESHGRVLIDCHAEAVCRRAFLRFLHKELKNYYEGGILSSIFESVPGIGILQLKKSISFHMYISQAPFGDATAFCEEDSLTQLKPEEEELVNSGAHFPTFDDDMQSILSCKYEEEQIAMPLEEYQVSMTLDDFQSGKAINVMSTSDKILRWNVLGLQGALLGNFVAPLYLTSITIAESFDHGHLTRAFCCRVAEDLGLPTLYKLNHPRVAPVHSPDESWQIPFNTSLSVNWTVGDQLIEVIDSKVGKSIPESPFRTSSGGASRLCKAGFLHRFKELVRLSKIKRLFGATTYSKLKKLNTNYLIAKNLFVKHLEEGNYGSWLQVPELVDEFP